MSLDNINFYETCDEIVDNVNLYEMYDELNEEYFNSKLPSSEELDLEWSTRQTKIAGSCNRKTQTIKLSVPYHKKFPQEVILTLAHEMIHLREKGHGYGFKAELSRLNRLGLPVRRYSLERATEKKLRWEYNCSNPACTNHFFRSRKIPQNRVCGKCKSRLIGKRIEESPKQKYAS